MRGRLVVAPALILGLALAACDVVYGPTSPSRDWATHDAARFTIYARPGSFADANAAALIEVLDDQYTVTSRALGLPEGPRIDVFLYERGADLNPSLPEARAGVAFPETNAFHAVAAPPLDDNLRALLAHEANHVIVHSGLGRAGTYFMNEGLASALVSERFGPVGRTALYQWTRSNRGRLPALADLIDDSKWSSSSDAGYKTSASFLCFLLERYGAAALKRLYYAHSDDFARSAATIYGKPLEVLTSEWLGAI